MGLPSLRAEFVTFEFEVEAATGKAEFAGRARDVAPVTAQGVRNHAALDFREGDGQCPTGTLQS